ncbi:MAG: transposase [Syntrophomonadaceae bacterium]|jgi:transposase
MSTRRRHSMETKLKVVKEVLETGNASLVARRYDLSSSMVSKWVRKYKQYGDAAFNEGSKRNGQLTEYTDKDYRKLENENERLKKILGEKELEVAILRDLLKK